VGGGKTKHKNNIKINAKQKRAPHKQRQMTRKGSNTQPIEMHRITPTTDNENEKSNTPSKKELKKKNK